MKLRTESNIAWHDTWDRIDNTSNPQWFVKFLDASRLRQLEIIKKDPAQYFSFLDIKPNMHVLDVGCGTGILLHPIAELVGEEGRVVGVDASDFMVKEARKRAGNTDLPLEFYKGNIYNLDFLDNTFDRATSSALFQHLKRPEEALHEVVRVIKPGGLISIFEHDWKTLIIHSSNDDISRKIKDKFCKSFNNSTIGRQLYSLIIKEGLENVSSTPMTINLNYDEFLSSNIGFYQTAQICADEEIITSEEKEIWLNDLSERASEGRFFLAFTSFRVVGRKQ